MLVPNAVTSGCFLWFFCCFVLHLGTFELQGTVLVYVSDTFPEQPASQSLLRSHSKLCYGGGMIFFISRAGSKCGAHDSVSIVRTVPSPHVQVFCAHRLNKTKPLSCSVKLNHGVVYNRKLF